MSLVDWIMIAVVLVILGLAVLYICRAKKKGARCIGCPQGGHCSGGCAGCASADQK